MALKQDKTADEKLSALFVVQVTGNESYRCAGLEFTRGKGIDIPLAALTQEQIDKLTRDPWLVTREFEAPDDAAQEAASGPRTRVGV